MCYKQLNFFIFLIIVFTINAIYADPLVYLKNNSDRRISVEPLVANTTFKSELVDSEGEYKVNDTGGPITGVRIKYCSKSAENGCNTDEAEFNKSAKTTTFYFNAPQAKRYYVKLSIDTDDKVSLKAQEGGLFGRTSNMKYSLSNNIKTDDIKDTPARPQQLAPTIRQVAPKIGISAPTMPSITQVAIIDKNVPFVEKRLKEIGEGLKQAKKLSSERNITRLALGTIEELFNKAVKKYTDLKSEMAVAEYQFTKNEETSSQEVDEHIIDVQSIISKLREFLKMPQVGSAFKSGSVVSTPNIGFTVQTEITDAELQKVLQGINELAPTLYKLIIKVDPTGKDHIFRDPRLGPSGASMRPSFVTGLPVTAVGTSVMDWPPGIMKFTIGHELSHYVLGHMLDEYHGDYPPEDILKRARQRINENECDRMAILEFGVSIDDGIAAVQRWLKESEEYTKPKEYQAPQRKTFKSTHPLLADRLKNLESLRREVEINKARNVPRKVIDWEKLAQENKKAGQPQRVDTSLVQKYLNKTYTQADLDMYVNKVKLKYKEDVGTIKFVQPDNDEKDKPWTLDSIDTLLGENLEDIDYGFGEGRVLTYEKHEDKIVSDVLHTYYNAKIFELKFRDNKEIRAVVKTKLEALLNKAMVGKSITSIIQKFEN